MLLTISTTHRPATDLGYLLYKNPSRVQTFDLSFGKAHVFYPQASEALATAALLLDVDPVTLVRGSGRSSSAFGLEQYVNDRPYVASSFLSVAIAQVFGSALSGTNKERPELADTSLPLTAKLAVVSVSGGENLLQRLFEPLGYDVQARRHELESELGWGPSNYFTVTLSGTCRLSDLLSHLYVLIPVLDNKKHYWVAEDEVEKLLRHGEGWLSSHPERNLIVSRYLKHRPSLTRQALDRLSEEDDLDPDARVESYASEEEAVEEKISLNQLRWQAVLAQLKESGANKVLDLGCGEGKFLKVLMEEGGFSQITGLDVSHIALERAVQCLRLGAEGQKGRQAIELIHGSLIYRDRRISGFDAGVCMEVIEHLDMDRLAAFERVVFEFARPGTLILTTPNVEYNANFPSLPAGKLRHKDHRFEWTRAEFRRWSADVAERFGYTVEFLSIGDEDPLLGPPTQMGVFTLCS